MMEMTYLVWLSIALLSGMTGFASPVVQGEMGVVSTMNSVDQRVTEKVAEFEKKQDPTFIYEALESIEAAQANMPLGDAAARKMAVSQWLHFFAELDRNIDPKWDPKNIPPRGVTPPSSQAMVVYSSGEIDPATIPDPQERAKYVQALKANKEENQHYFVQSELRHIDERAMRFVERLLADRYTNSTEDKREFEELLASSSINEQRKERLRALRANPAQGAS